MAETKAIVFLCIIGLVAVSSWIVSRRSRRILRRSLGRDVSAADETSLRAWMSVPDGTLTSAHEELANDPAARVLEVLEPLNRRPGGRPQRDHEPYSDHLSIR